MMRPLRILSLVFACGLGISAMAEKPLCEGDLSTPGTNFLHALRVAVESGDLSTENLAWMIQQPYAVDPILAARRPENLAFKQRMRREIQHITPGQWQVIKNEVREMLENKTGQKYQIDVAADKTQNIFVIRPTGFKFPREQRFIRHFTSSQRETYLLTHDSEHSYIYNLRTNNVIKVSGHAPRFPKELDIFETSRGEVLLALVSETDLIVVNALTGETLFSVADKVVTAYAPLLFESHGLINVALGTPSDVSVLERDALMAKLHVRFTPGQEPTIFPIHKFAHVVRLKDGHVYGSYFLGRENRLTLELHDYTLDQDILTVRDLNVKLKGFASALIYDHGPKLLINLDSKTWHVFDARRKKLIPLTSVSTGIAIRSLVYPHEEATNIVTLATSKGFEIQMQNVLRNSSESVQLPFDPDSAFVSNDEKRRLITTSDGMWTYEWEWKDGRRSKMHLYNLRTKEIVTLDVPQTFDTVLDIFADANNSRILMPVSYQNSRWELYQVFGPERFQE